VRLATKATATKSQARAAAASWITASVRVIGTRGPVAEWQDPAEEAVMRLLAAGGEMYGLQLVKASAGVLKRGTVYLVLDRLEDAGLVASREENEPADGVGIKRRLYRSTQSPAPKLAEVKPLPRVAREGVVEALEMLTEKARAGELTDVLVLFKLDNDAEPPAGSERIGRDCMVGGAWSVAEMLFVVELWKSKLLALCRKVQEGE
jgi:DNA-binding PadR family transcriptional regulator